MDELTALLAQMSPEELDQLMALNTSGDRSGLALQDYSRGMGMQDAPMQPHTSFAGGLLGGIGQGLGNAVGGFQMNQARGQQGGLLDQRQGLMARLAKLLQKPAALPQMGDFDADDSMGMMG